MRVSGPGELTSAEGMKTTFPTQGNDAAAFPQVRSPKDCGAARKYKDVA